MIESLNDKYTRFVPPKEFEEERNMIKGSLFGIGILQYVNLISLGLGRGNFLLYPIEFHYPY